MSAVLGNPRIRPMRSVDVDAVIALEKGAYDYPWTAGIFRDCLRVGYSCWVIELEGELAGYAILGVGADEAHILNICVGKAWQGQGLGARLLARVIDLARWHRAESIFLEVRPSNFRAVRMYRSAGFRTVGRRPNYYPAATGREDALIMSFRLRDEPPGDP